MWEGPPKVAVKGACGGSYLKWGVRWEVPRFGEGGPKDADSGLKWCKETVLVRGK